MLESRGLEVPKSTVIESPDLAVAIEGGVAAGEIVLKLEFLKPLDPPCPLA